jgi:hypothetical protein
MPEDHDEYLGTRLVNGTWFLVERDRLEPFSGARIPTNDPLTRYMADLACACGYSLMMSFDNLRRFGARARKSTDWGSAACPVAVGMSIWYYTLKFEDRRLVSGLVGKHLEAELNRACPGAGEFVSAATTIDLAQSSAKAARLLDEQAQRLGIKLKYDRAEVMMGIPDQIRVAENWLPRTAMVTCGIPEGELYRPLLAAAVPPTGRVGKQSLPSPLLESPAASERPAFVTGQHSTALGDYASWRQYCVRLAALRRIPEQLIADLLPTPERAEWAVVDPHEMRVALEQAQPGRDAWLKLEGVSETDFLGFWNKPTWVRVFIEALVDRNWELQVEAISKDTGDQDGAVMSALLFIPRFSVFALAEPSAHSPLPFELFDRVNAYWTSLSDDAINKIAVEGHFMSATELIRNRIAQGLLA